MSNADNYLETAFQTPIFLSQSQLDQGGSSLIGLVCGLAGIFVFYIALIALIKKDQETILKEKLAAERFVQNTHLMSESLFKPYLIGVKRIGTSWGKIISIVFLLAWIVAIIVITTGLQTISIINPDEGNYAQIQAGLVLYFVALIGYFISRVLAYYKDKLEVRKKVRAHKRALAKGMPDTLPRANTAEDDIYVKPSDLLSPVTTSLNVAEGIRNSLSASKSDIAKDPSVDLARRKSEKKFDQFFNYRRRIKHSTPVYQKVYFNTLNSIQILVLITEFFQLASFPVRDLFRSDSFLQSLQAPQGQSSLNFINGIRSLLAVFSTGLVSIDFDYVKFVLSWWLAIIGLSVAVLFTGLHYLIQTDYVSSRLNATHKRLLTNFLGGRWIVLTLPLINLFYLVILNAFLEPLSCLSSNNTPIFPVAFEDIAEASQKRIYQCYAIHTAAPIMNTWYALSGFTIAFFLFSICRTANEPQPEDGVINYTSRSELWLKMCSISLLIIYALVPSQDTAAGRGVLAILILIFMTLYNVIIGSTYSRWVNFGRSLSFLSTLWLSAVVAYYTDESRKFELYLAGSGVWTVILVGWIVLWSVYTVLDVLVIQKWENSCQDENGGIEIPEIMLEQGESSSDGVREASEVSATSYTYSHGVNGPRPMNDENYTNSRRASAGPRPMPAPEQRGSITSLSSAKRGSLPNVPTIAEVPNARDASRAPLSTASVGRTSLDAPRPPSRTPSPLTSPRPERPSVGGSRPLPANFVYKQKS